MPRKRYTVEQIILVLPGFSRETFTQFRHDGLECDRRFVAERRMASGWIVEAVDVPANGVFGLVTGLKAGPPDEL